MVLIQKLREFTKNSVHSWRMWESKDSLIVESLLEILTKRKSQAFYKFTDVHSVTNVLGEIISSLNMESCEPVSYDFCVCVGSK